MYQSGFACFQGCMLGVALSESDEVVATYCTFPAFTSADVDLFHKGVWRLDEFRKLRNARPDPL